MRLKHVIIITALEKSTFSDSNWLIFVACYIISSNLSNGSILFTQTPQKNQISNLHLQGDDKNAMHTNEEKIGIEILKKKNAINHHI